MAPPMAPNNTTFRPAGPHAEFRRAPLWKPSRPFLESRTHLMNATALAQRLEGCSELLSEQLGFFPGGEVAAPVGLVEVNEIGVDLLGPAARRLDDFTREDGESNRQRELGWFLPRSERCPDALGFLPVE